GQVMIKISTHRDFKFMAEHFNTLVPEESKVPLSLEEKEDCKGYFELLTGVFETTAFLTKCPSWMRNYIPGIKQYNNKLIANYKELWRRIEADFVQRRRAEIENTPDE